MYRLVCFWEIHWKPVAVGFWEKTPIYNISRPKISIVVWLEISLNGLILMQNRHGRSQTAISLMDRLVYTVGII